MISIHSPNDEFKPKRSLTDRYGRIGVQGFKCDNCGNIVKIVKDYQVEGVYIKDKCLCEIRDEKIDLILNTNKR